MNLPNYSNIYQTYLDSVYHTLIGFSVLSIILLLGWFVVEFIYRKNPLKSLIEWIYLAGAAGTFIAVIAYFTR